jgi:predicted ArsR family transcriptional regulator
MNLLKYRILSGLCISAAAKLLYCYLLDLSDGYKNSVAISIKKLARGVGISRSAARRNLHRLERLDMIGISPRYTEDGGRLSNQYMLK